MEKGFLKSGVRVHSDGKMLGKDGKALQRNVSFAVVATTEPAGKSACSGEAADSTRDVGFESAGSLDEGAAVPINELQFADSAGPDVVSANEVATPHEAAISPKAAVHVNGGNEMGESKTEGTTFSNVLNATRTLHKIHFRTLVNEECVENHDTLLPIDAMKKVLTRYDNTLVGYFLGKTIAFPNVKSYVTNTWGKFGLQKLMKNGDGVYLFKFATKEGVDRVLERGPWLIRNSPIILNKWTSTLSLNRNEVNKVPVWIKLHNVPLVAYSEDGLSLIATQVGKPIMLDAFTSSMCVDSWGRISFARALVEVRADSELKSQVKMAIPNEEGNGYTTEIINVEYEWKPPHCIDCKSFGHALFECPKRVEETVQQDINVAANVSNLVENHEEGFIEVRNRKNKGKSVADSSQSRTIGGVRLTKPKPKFWRPKHGSDPKVQKETSSFNDKSGTNTKSSNPFDVLTSLGDEGVDGFPPNGKEEGQATASKPSPSSSPCTTPVVEKIEKLEKLIIEGKASLVDVDGKPIKKVDSSAKVGNPFSTVGNPFSKVGNLVVSDSDDDEVFDDHIGTLYPGSRGKDNSPYEQWKADTGDNNNYNEDDFDLTPAQLKAVGMQDFFLK